MGLTAITPSGLGSSIASDLLWLERTCLTGFNVIVLFALRLRWRLCAPFAASAIGGVH